LPNYSNTSVNVLKQYSIEFYVKINVPTVNSVNLLTFQNLVFQFTFYTHWSYSYKLLNNSLSIVSQTWGEGNSSKIGNWVGLAATVINIGDSYLSKFSFVIDKTVFTNNKFAFAFPSASNKIYLRKDTVTMSTSFAYIRLWKVPVSVTYLFQNIGKFFFDSPTNMLMSYYDFRTNRLDQLTFDFYDSLKELPSYTQTPLSSVSNNYSFDDSFSIQCGKTTMLNKLNYPNCIKRNTTLRLTYHATNKISLASPPGTVFTKSLSLLSAYTFEIWMKLSSMPGSNMTFLDTS